MSHVKARSSADIFLASTASCAALTSAFSASSALMRSSKATVLAFGVEIHVALALQVVFGRRFLPAFARGSGSGGSRGICGSGGSGGSAILGPLVLGPCAA